MMKSRVTKFVRFEDWRSERSDSSDNEFSTNARESARNFLSNIGRGIQKSSERIRRLKKIPTSHFVNRKLDKDSGTRKKILDPQGAILQKWNKIFVLSCIIALSLDPLFFYIPVIDNTRKCLGLDRPLEIIACVLRTFTDLFHVIRIIFQFHTGFIAPSSRVFGRGELIDDPSAIAKRYLSSYFIVDILSILPLPQVVVLAVIPSIQGPVPMLTKELLKIVIFIQYVPRIWRIYPLFKQVTRTSGILTETAWAGAAFNLFLYMLASHVVGAFWYLFSLEQADTCWRKEFRMLDLGSYHLYCSENPPTGAFNFTSITAKLNASCPFIEPDDIKDPSTFNFGIFADALKSGVVTSRDFPSKFFFCFWWGLRNLSSLGQNLTTSTNVAEIVFAVSIAIGGLVLFSLLIGNMQKYLQSTTVRIEEMRVKRRDAEQWMAHRMLPETLRERIRRHEQYKWQETRGVEEDTLIRNLPKDLRRDIKRHLCLALLTRVSAVLQIFEHYLSSFSPRDLSIRFELFEKVPIFEKMDEQLLDAMCDRLKPVLYTEKSSIVREGDPVDEMLFIMRGKLATMTTNGGRTGFFNTADLKAGDFCGEELLTWALDPNSTSNLPSSTRTVEAKTEVEGFALMADDLKFVATQFRRLHNKQFQHTFRFYSLQWRTWAACFIQVAWRRYCKRMLDKSLREAEDRLQDALANEAGPAPSLGATIYASRFASNVLRALRQNGSHGARHQQRLLPLLPQKPAEPDFTS